MYSEIIAPNFFVSERTLSEFADGYNQPLADCNVQYTDSCIPHNDPSWYGNISSVKEAEDLLNKGWSDGAKRAMELKEKLEAYLPKVKSRKRRQIWGDDGHSIDVDRAILGQWDSAWRTTIRETGPLGNQTCITLNCGLGGNCYLTSEQLFWSGAVMAVLGDALENAGYSTKLNAVLKSRIWGSPEKYAIQKIVVKDHGEPLRIDGLAGVVAHAGVFRTFGFRVICQIPWNVSSGLGQMVTWEEIKKPAENAKYQPEPNSINILDCFSEEEAKNEIKRILKDFEA